MWTSFLILSALVIGYIDLRHRHRLARRLAKRYHLETVAEFDELHELTMLLQSVQLRAPLPPLRRYVIAPDFGRHLIEMVRERKPKTVVELGSGASTVLSAYALEEHGEGKVFSFEEVESYADISRQMIEKHSLEQFAEVFCAPLGEDNWYQLVDLPEIDLLVVDGPQTPSHRYPVLDRLLSQMSSSGVVLVDDTHHPQMIDVVARWRQKHPYLTFTALPMRRGAMEISLPQQQLPDGQMDAQEMATAH